MTDKDILIQQLFEQIRLLQAENAVLREEIARLKKNSSNSSKPPSSDIVNPRIDLKSKRKRKPGGQKGHGKFIREPFAPEQIDMTIIHKLSTQEIQRRNLIVLDETQMAFQQIDLSDKFYKVIEHRVQLYQTPVYEMFRNRPIIKMPEIFPEDFEMAGRDIFFFLTYQVLNQPITPPNRPYVLLYWTGKLLKAHEANMACVGAKELGQ